MASGGAALTADVLLSLDSGLLLSLLTPPSVLFRDVAVHIGATFLDLSSLSASMFSAALSSLDRPRVDRPQAVAGLSPDDETLSASKRSAAATTTAGMLGRAMFDPSFLSPRCLLHTAVSSLRLRQPEAASAVAELLTLGSVHAAVLELKQRRTLSSSARSDRLSAAPLAILLQQDGRREERVLPPQSSLQEIVFDFPLHQHSDLAASLQETLATAVARGLPRLGKLTLAACHASIGHLGAVTSPLLDLELRGCTFDLPALPARASLPDRRRSDPHDPLKRGSGLSSHDAESVTGFICPKAPRRSLSSTNTRLLSRTPLFQTLVSLTLVGCDDSLTDAAVVRLFGVDRAAGRALHFPALLRLSIFMSDISDDALVALRPRLWQPASVHARDRPCHLLKTFCLTECGNVTPAGVSSALFPKEPTPGHLMTHLTYCSLNGCYDISDSGFIAALAENQTAMMARSLTMFKCQRLTRWSDAAVGVLGRFVHLRVLHLGSCSDVTDAGIHGLVFGCDPNATTAMSLEDLRLDTCPLLTDAALLSIADSQSGESLRTLRLEGTRKFTGAGIAGVLATSADRCVLPDAAPSLLPCLTSFDISGASCANVPRDLRTIAANLYDHDRASGSTDATCPPRVPRSRPAAPRAEANGAALNSRHQHVELHSHPSRLRVFTAASCHSLSAVAIGALLRLATGPGHAGVCCERHLDSVFVPRCDSSLPGAPEPFEAYAIGRFAAAVRGLHTLDLSMWRSLTEPGLCTVLGLPHPSHHSLSSDDAAPTPHLPCDRSHHIKEIHSTPLPIYASAARSCAPSVAVAPHCLALRSLTAASLPEAVSGPFVLSLVARYMPALTSLDLNDVGGITNGALAAFAKTPGVPHIRSLALRYCAIGEPQTERLPAVSLLDALRSLPSLTSLDALGTQASGTTVGAAAQQALPRLRRLYS